MVVGGAYYATLMMGAGTGAGMAAGATVGVGALAGGMAIASSMVGPYLFGRGGRNRNGRGEISSSSGDAPTYPVDGSDVNQPPTSTASYARPRVQRDGASSAWTNTAFGQWHRNYRPPTPPGAEVIHSGASTPQTPVIQAATGGSSTTAPVQQLGTSVYLSNGGEIIDDDTGVAFVNHRVYTAIKGIAPRSRLPSPVESPEADHARDLAEQNSLAELAFREEQEASQRSSIISELRSRLRSGATSRSDELAERAVAVERALFGNAQRYYMGTLSSSPDVTGGRNTPASQRSGYQGAEPPPVHGMQTLPQ